MNIYKKLQNVRIDLQDADLKKSGKNTFAKYSYFELGDFLPMINILNKRAGLFTQVSFTQDSAKLTLINIDDVNETITFESPMSSAELKGAHAIQNLGAVETYQRRYLYMMAYEIVEHDSIDSSKPLSQKEKNESDLPIALEKIVACSTVEDLQKIWGEFSSLQRVDEFKTAISTAKKALTND